MSSMNCHLRLPGNIYWETENGLVVLASRHQSKRRKNGSDNLNTYVSTISNFKTSWMENVYQHNVKHKFSAIKKIRSLNPIALIAKLPVHIGEETLEPSIILKHFYALKFDSWWSVPVMKSKMWLESTVDDTQKIFLSCLHKKLVLSLYLQGVS